MIRASSDGGNALKSLILLKTKFLVLSFKALINSSLVSELFISKKGTNSVILSFTYSKLNSHPSLFFIAFQDSFTN